MLGQSEEEIDSLTNLAFELHDRTPEEAVEICRQILKRSDLSIIQLANSQNTLGLAEMELGNLDKAGLWLHRALNNREKAGETDLIAGTLSNLGAFHQRQSQYDSAAQYLIAAIGRLEGTLDQSRLPSFENNLGNVLAADGQAEEALTYHEQARAGFAKLGDTLGIADATYNIGIRYLEMGQSGPALEAFRQAAEYYNQLRRAYDAILARNALGVLYLNLGQLDSSRQHFRKCLQYYETHATDPVAWSDTYLNLALLEQEEGNMSESLRLLKQAEQTLGNYGGLYDYWYLENTWSETYAIAGQFDSAFIHQKRAQTLNDSLYNLEKAETIAELQTRYEVDLKEKENETLTAIAEKNANQRNLFIVISALLLILGGLVAWFLNQRARNRRLINQQQRQLHRQTVEELVRKQEVEAYQSMLDGQESERKRLAAELHDRVGGTLTGLKWQFEAISDQVPDEEAAKQIRGLINMTYAEVREISHNMAGSFLGKFGLKKAAEDLIRAAHRPGKMRARMHTHGLEDRLEPETEITIYRLLQELISNVLKHADASELVVQIERIDTNVHLTVSDNGRGFDPEGSDGQGLGLRNMQNRVADLQGSLTIDSGRGGGTTVMIELPL